MLIKVMVKKSGNCGCYNCGRTQDGLKMHPYTVWHKTDSEKRGHKDPVCSLGCGAEYANKIEEKYRKLLQSNSK